MKKGISLPVETTVIIVIAVIVLVALLLFFSGTVNPGIDRIKLESQKATLCSDYVSVDKECENTNKFSAVKDSKTLEDLADVGKKLGNTGCSSKTATIDCVRQVCATFCSGNLRCEGQGYVCATEIECATDVGTGKPGGQKVAGKCDKSDQICCKKAA